MRQLAKFWSLARDEKKLLCEAGILLLLSKACVKAIAFKHIDKFLRTRWNDGGEDGVDRDREIGLVQRSVLRAANVVPWRSLCLSRSIAEYIMLRRRGISAVMLVGVRFSDNSSLDAHAWVETGVLGNDKNLGNSTFITVMMIGTRAANR